MDLNFSPTTCSMAEVVYLDEHRSRTAAEELANWVGEASRVSRKMLIANVAACQAKNKDLIDALKANGFKRVGMYYGNSGQNVHVYIRGLRTRVIKKSTGGKRAGRV